MHDHDVAGAHHRVEEMLARGDGRDQHLGHTEWQLHHRGRAHHCAFGAPQAHNGAQFAALIAGERQLLERLTHARHGTTAAAGVAQLVDGEAAVFRCLLPADVMHRGEGNAQRLTQDAGIDDRRLKSQRLQAVAQIGNFCTFGVERADDVDGWMHKELSLIHI